MNDLAPECRSIQCKISFRVAGTYELADSFIGPQFLSPTRPRVPSVLHRRRVQIGLRVRGLFQNPGSNLAWQQAPMRR